MSLPEIFRAEKSELEKLIKKGWSENKISRWLEDRKKIRKRKSYKNITGKEGTDAENWLAYIQNLFEKTEIKHFGILLHWYKSGPENERIGLRERKRLKLTEINTDILLHMEEDRIYNVVR